MNDAPFSPAAERNKTPILDVLREIVTDDDHKILEVGSGTGQHGAYFAQELPGIEWLYSDMVANHDGIKANKAESAATNLLGPVSYEIGKDPFPKGRFDLVYTANTFHIMSWKHVKTFIKTLGKELRPGARFVVYGPFKYEDKPMAQSNVEFDAMLRERDAASGIRNFEDVKGQLESRGFRLLKDYEMPANNRTLVFLKF